MFAKLADKTQLGRAASMLKDMTAIQSDFGKRNESHYWQIQGASLRQE